jgi:hypothetical protein
MKRLAAVVFVIGVVGCVAAAIFVGLDEPDADFEAAANEIDQTQDLQPLIDAAMSDYKANDANADSAPKQQVVNGWVARDLLHAIAQQNVASAKTLDGLVAIQAASPPDDRPARLLAILAILVGWIGIWAATPRLLASPRQYAAAARSEAPPVVTPDPVAEPLTPPEPPAAAPPPTPDVDPLA